MKLARRKLGISLVEVVMCVGALAVSIGGLGMSVIATQRAGQDLRNRDMVRAQTLKIMERLLAIPYGNPAEPQLNPADAAVATAIGQLFDDDPSVVAPSGLLTLMNMRTNRNAAGWRFRVGGFEAGGVWEVEINNDLDGNGVNTGSRGNQVPTDGLATPAGDGDEDTIVTLVSENRPDLYRIEVFYNGRSVGKTFRCVQD